MDDGWMDGWASSMALVCVLLSENSTAHTKAQHTQHTHQHTAHTKAQHTQHAHLFVQRHHVRQQPLQHVVVVDVDEVGLWDACGLCGLMFGVGVGGVV